MSLASRPAVTQSLDDLADHVQMLEFWSNLLLVNLTVSSNYPDDAAAAAGGVPVGHLYHTSGTVKIRLS